MRLEAATLQEFAFECGVEALAHRVVVTVADGPHRWQHAGFVTAQTVGDRGVPATLVGGVDDVRRATPEIAMSSASRTSSVRK